MKTNFVHSAFKIKIIDFFKIVHFIALFIFERTVTSTILTKKEEIKIVHIKPTPGSITESTSLVIAASTDPTSTSFDPLNTFQPENSNTVETLPKFNFNSLLNLTYFIPTLTSELLIPDKIMGNSEFNQDPRLIFGIPTVYRKSDTISGSHYLINTLTQMVSGLQTDKTSFKKEEILILITVGETNITLANSIFESINSTFSQELLSGLILVVKPQGDFYSASNDLGLAPKFAHS